MAARSIRPSRGMLLGILVPSHAPRGNPKPGRFGRRPGGVPVVLLLALAWSGCLPAVDIPEVIVGGLDYGFELDATLEAGPTKFGFENRGQVPHELVLARLRPGVTLVDMISGMMEGGDPEQFADGLGGILVADPGELAMGRLYLELESGRSYALICLFEDQDGDPPHVALGMVRSFLVE